MRFFPVVLLILFILFAISGTPLDFKESQLKYSRVRKSYENKGSYMKKLLDERKISASFDLYLRAFKEEGIFEAWVKDKKSQHFVLLKSFLICKPSGTLGPKRRQGDLQVPEGFYHIDRFNPSSNFHLSLGINYPNNSDKVLSSYQDLGGDIFIHGGCVTIGCLPLEDHFIEEVYILAVEARSHGQQKIPVHIFPSKLTSAKVHELNRKYSEEKGMLNFWLNLKEGFDYFEEKKQLPVIASDKEGNYLFK